MPNRLAGQTSPYLRQHADNPVDWFPWGDEAFALAADSDRPILLSVGYSSCHWCHVMAHESFEDDETAALMNEWFVCVKVDREERPDVDAIYMEATQAMTGHGGWPMTVFATPDGAPFFCGTYFPDEPRGGQPSFRQLLAAVHEAWTERRAELLDQSQRVADAIRSATVPTGTELPDAQVLDEATSGMLAAFDDQWGGFGRAPKFPQAMSLDHLLRATVRTGSAAARAAALASVDAMVSGGIYDHLGGGFSRYSVDERWLVPHFEKMLYDNALLLRLLVHAWQVSGDDHYLQIIDETVTYVLRDLSHPDGGRYSAEDADSLASHDAEHAEEGEFYVWTPAQVAEALSAAGLAELTEATCAWFDITEGGNFEGRSIPNRLRHRGDWIRSDELDAARQALFDARGTRPRPGLDDKVLTEWNALMLSALCEAAGTFGRPDWFDAAIANGEFLLRELRDERGRWHRSWHAEGRPQARHHALAADHACLVDAFTRLGELSGQARWTDAARQVADTMLDLFWDTRLGGLFTTPDDGEQLVARQKELIDNATPGANSMAAYALYRLGVLTGERRYVHQADQILQLIAPAIAQVPSACSQALSAVALRTEGTTEIVIVGDRPEMVAVVQQRWLPDAVLALGQPFDSPLWEGRSPGLAYVCRNYACQLPVDDVDALVAQLHDGDLPG